MTYISIHAPHAGSDQKGLLIIVLIMIFQSTLPMRGATQDKQGQNRTVSISIHAPHAGSDRQHLANYSGWYDFNPRSPCGERLLPNTIASIISHFNPRSPCGERLDFHIDFFHQFDFNPRSPCGERPRITPKMPTPF